MFAEYKLIHSLDLELVNFVVPLKEEEPGYAVSYSKNNSLKHLF